MHSGDDLFVETGRDASAIAAAGRRRTRRNQVGGAAAGGLLALGLVFGVSSQLGDDEPTEIASEAQGQAAPEMTEMAEIEADDTIAAADEATLAPAFVPFELVVGVDEEFAGLRATENGVVAIRSIDGVEWSESPTTGIPSGAELTVLVHDELFAATFTLFDDVSLTSTSYIGTSIDLTEWTVVEVDLGDDFDAPFLGEIALVDGEVVAVTMASPPFDEDAESFPDQMVVTIRGPIGGPYTPDALELVGFGVGQLRSAAGTAMFALNTDEGADVVASAGADWDVVRGATFAEFPTLATDGSALLLIDSSGVERTDDGGRTWVPVDTDFVEFGPMSSATAVTGDATVAVLFAVPDDQGANVGYVLAAGASDALEEVTLGALVPERAFVSLVAVNDEEALLEVFPEPEVFDEELAASGGLVEVEPGQEESDGENEPRYVRIPLG